MKSCHKDYKPIDVFLALFMIPASMLLIAVFICGNYHALTYRSFNGTLVSSEMKDIDGRILLYYFRKRFS
jgi:hypothetical protein